MNQKVLTRDGQHMNIRELQKNDQVEIEKIYDLYWPDSDIRKSFYNRLDLAINNELEYLERRYKYFVAEDSEEVVGVIGLRMIRPTDFMSKFVKTTNASEIYIVAVKKRGQGIGRKLVEKALEEIRAQGYMETVLYSSESHKESWGFYDYLGFERVGPELAPNGEPGCVWRMEFK